MDKATRIKRDLIRDDPVEFCYAILGMKLHPKQIEYLKDRNQFKNALWGRRGGKSTCDAVDLLHWAIKYPGLPQYNTSFSYDQAMITFNYADRMMVKCGLNELLECPPIHSPFGLMRFIGGSTIHARSLQHFGKFILGHGAARVKVDEAQIVPDRTVNEAVLPMLTDYNGQLCKSGTPRGKRGHFHRSYERGRDTRTSKRRPGHFSLHCPSWDNPFVSREFIQTMKEELTEIQFREQFGAEFMDASGRLFPFHLIQKAYNVESMNTDPKDSHVYVAGWDFAKDLDWTVGYVLDITNEADTRIVFKERFQKEPYQYVIQRVKEVTEMYHVSSTCVDATSLGSVIVDVLSDEVPNLEAFVFSAQSKQSLMNNLRLVLEQGRVHFDYDEDLVNELTYYEYEVSGRSANILMGTQKEHDDCATAFALAAWALKQQWASSSIGVVGVTLPETKPDAKPESTHA